MKIKKDKKTTDTNYLKEGWVEFIRINCIVGFIDRWMGDEINNPNRPSKSGFQLNAFAVYYRLNGQGEWINRRDINEVENLLHNFKETRSAEQIWNTAIKINKK